MTLTEIKEKITGELNKVIIDDFYSDPRLYLNIVKFTFSEITKLKTDEEFANFLTAKYPQTNAQFLSNQSVKDEKQKELDLIQGVKKTHFENEYFSLNFLFKTLLHKSFGDDDFLRLSNQKLDLYQCGFDEVCKVILPYLNSNNTIPKNWREIIYKYLSIPFDEITGTISKITYDSTAYFKRESLPLTHLDASAFLATKIGLKTKDYIEIGSNKIVLALPGGLSAEISIREKGSLITKFQQQPFEIFAHCISTNQYVLQTLYHQKGYADSKIQVETPGAYYMLTDKFVIEIKFYPAPILFDSNSVIKYTPNISSKAKLEDEIAEEERRKKQEQEEEDYY